MQSVSRDGYSADFFIAVADSAQHGNPNVFTYYYEQNPSSSNDWNGKSMFNFADITGISTDGTFGVVSRDSTDMEFFYISDDYTTVRSRYWTAAKENWHLSDQDKAITAASDTSIAAVSREPNHMEIFYFDTDQNLRHSYTVLWSMPDTGGSPPVRGSVGTASKDNDNLEVYWILEDSTIVRALWTSTTGWQPMFVAMQSSIPSNSSNIAVISRSENNMDVFYIGNDNTVYHVSYNGTDVNPSLGNEQISTIDAAPGYISAVSLSSDHMEVFWVGTDGSIGHADYTSGNGWQSEVMPAVAAGSCKPGFPINALGRGALNTIDVWCTSNDPTKIIHAFYGGGV
ncbi:hypothetical protein GGI43DRAFT_431713 [Trichoderma evansii]